MEAKLVEHQKKKAAKKKTPSPVDKKRQKTRAS
jgi:hypothetical protein